MLCVIIVILKGEIMKTKCPHCDAENEGNKGDLIRCVGCKKAIEIGSNTEEIRQKIQRAQREKEQRAKASQLEEKKLAQKQIEKAKAQQQECPFCLELIHKNATICKHCHSIINFDERRLNHELKKAEKSSGLGVALFFMIVGYIAVVLGILLAVTYSLVGGCVILSTGLNAILMSHVATAVIKTSHYTKMIASKHQ